MHDRSAAHLARVPRSSGAVDVFRLLNLRKAAERRSHRARGKRARQLAFLDLLAVKEDLAAYRVRTSPVGVQR